MLSRVIAAFGARMTAVLGALVLVACAGPSESALAVPTRPPLPDGWVVLEGDQGDVQMAVPPDMAQLHIGHSLVAQLPVDMELGRVTLEVTASPPAILPNQPEVGQSVQDWLEEIIDQMTPEPGIATRGPTSTRQVALPAGLALELRTSFSAAGPEDVIVLYAIRTSSGFGLLQFLGQQPTMERRSEDIRLMTLLIEFGPVAD